VKGEKQNYYIYDYLFAVLTYGGGNMPTDMTSSDGVIGSDVGLKEYTAQPEIGLESKIHDDLLEGKVVEIGGSAHDMIELYGQLLKYVNSSFIDEEDTGSDSGKGISFSVTGRNCKGHALPPDMGRTSRGFNLVQQTGFLGMRKKLLVDCEYQYHIGSGAAISVSVTGDAFPYREKAIDDIALILGNK
jgi:hypothetical protein